MFESICIREQENGLFDLGFLAEAMLFYQQVRVIGRVAAVRQLVKAFGPDRIVEALQSGRLKLSYMDTMGGIQTLNSGTSMELHAPISISAVRHKLQDVAPEIFIEAIGRSGAGRRTSAHFVSFVDIQPYEKSILESANADFRSVDFLNLAFREVLTAIVPDLRLPNVLVQTATEVNGSIRLVTDVDFALATALFRRRNPKSDTKLSTSYVLAQLLGATLDLNIAASNNSELATTRASSATMQLKVRDVLEKRQRSDLQLASFQDLVFNEAKVLREVINSGERTLAEVLDLLDRAERFRAWTKGHPPSAELCKEYYRAITKDSWVDKLPGKASRWVIFTGAGLGLDALGAGGLGTAAGVALSAVDQFMLDKVVKGWKPSQFVEGPLRQFVGG
jgi:hypothetical protein